MRERYSLPVIKNAWEILNDLGIGEIMTGDFLKDLFSMGDANTNTDNVTLTRLAQLVYGVVDKCLTQDKLLQLYIVVSGNENVKEDDLYIEDVAEVLSHFFVSTGNSFKGLFSALMKGKAAKRLLNPSL